MWASGEGRYRVAELFAEHSVDMMLKDKNGKSTGEMAFENGYKQLDEMLLRRIDGR